MSEKQPGLEPHNVNTIPNSAIEEKKIRMLDKHHYLVLLFDSLATFISVSSRKKN